MAPREIPQTQTAPFLSWPSCSQVLYLDITHTYIQRNTLLWSHCRLTYTTYGMSRRLVRYDHPTEEGSNVCSMVCAVLYIAPLHSSPLSAAVASVPLWKMRRFPSVMQSSSISFLRLVGQSVQVHACLCVNLLGCVIAPLLLSFDSSEQATHTV